MFTCQRCLTTGFSQAHCTFESRAAARRHLVEFHPHNAELLIERLSNLVFVGDEYLAHVLSDKERPKS